MIIKHISKKFETKIHKLSQIELIKLWFKEIDNLYFTNENEITIILSRYDKHIILKSKDCLEKLKVLSFKKNISIPNFKNCINYTNCRNYISFTKSRKSIKNIKTYPKLYQNQIIQKLILHTNNSHQSSILINANSNIYNYARIKSYKLSKF